MNFASIQLMVFSCGIYTICTADLSTSVDNTTNNSTTKRELPENFTEIVRDLLRNRTFVQENHSKATDPDDILHIVSMVNRRKQLKKFYKALESTSNCSFTYKDVMLVVTYDNQCPSIISHLVDDDSEEEEELKFEKSILLALDEFSNQSSKYPYPCTARNITENSTNAVRIVNTTECLKILSTEQDWDVNGTAKHHCAMVLFYSASCTFSAKMAPHYNALGRAFPGVDILAVDVLQSNGLYARYGIVAVPNILLFHRGKPVLRFNYSERTFESFKTFLENNTGLSANSSVTLSDQDYEGPLSNQPVEQPDYTLWFSNTFLILFLFYIINQNLGENFWRKVKEYSDYALQVWRTGEFYEQVGMQDLDNDEGG